MLQLQYIFWCKSQFWDSKSEGQNVWRSEFVTLAICSFEIINNLHIFIIFQKLEYLTKIFLKCLKLWDNKPNFWHVGTGGKGNVMQFLSFLLGGVRLWYWNDSSLRKVCWCMWFCRCNVACLLSSRWYERDEIVFFLFYYIFFYFKEWSI